LGVGEAGGVFVEIAHNALKSAYRFYVAVFVLLIAKSDSVTGFIQLGLKNIHQ
jgi:hypothetical protein